MIRPTLHNQLQNLFLLMFWNELNYNFIVEGPPWRERTWSRLRLCDGRRCGAIRAQDGPHDVLSYKLELSLALESLEKRAVRNECAKKVEYGPPSAGARNVSRHVFDDGEERDPHDCIFQ